MREYRIPLALLSLTVFIIAGAHYANTQEAQDNSIPLHTPFISKLPKGTLLEDNTQVKEVLDERFSVDIIHVYTDLKINKTYAYAQSGGNSVELHGMVDPLALTILDIAAAQAPNLGTSVVSIKGASLDSATVHLASSGDVEEIFRCTAHSVAECNWEDANVPFSIIGGTVTFTVTGDGHYAGGVKQDQTMVTPEMRENFTFDTADASIQFKQPVTLPANARAQDVMRTGRGWVFVDSATAPGLNKPAQLALFNLPYKHTPSIFKDGELCQNCGDISYAGNTLRFTVNGFSNYSATSNSQLNISDDTESIPTEANQYVSFYANFTNTTDGLAITGAACEFSENSSGGWSAPVNMTYNGTTTLYFVNKTFTAAGTYLFNVSCSASGYETVSLTDEFTISSDATPPVISNIQVQNNTDSTVNITWTTDENANSSVQFGTTTALEESANSSATLTTTQSLLVSTAQSNTLYYFNVTSCDSSGNCATSGPNSFTAQKRVCVNETSVCFTNVTAAVNNASSGQTVVITDNATYEEALTISKSLTITSNGTGLPTLNGTSGSTIYNTAGTITLRYLNVSYVSSSTTTRATLRGGPFIVTDSTIHYTSSSTWGGVYLSTAGWSTFDRVNFTTGGGANSAVYGVGGNFIINNSRSTGVETAVWMNASAAIIENSYLAHATTNTGTVQYTNITNTTIIGELNGLQYLQIVNSTIEYGLTVDGYGNSITNTSITDTVEDALVMNAISNLTVSDSNFTLGSGLDAFNIPNAANNRINLSTYNVNITMEEVEVLSAGTDDIINVTLRSYLDVYVNDSVGNPVQGATVNLTDAYSSQVFSTTSNANGYMDRATVVYGSHNGSDSRTFTNHWLRGFKESVGWNSTYVNMSTNQNVTLTLEFDTVAPVVSVITIVNNTNNSVNITWTTNEYSNSSVQYGTTTDLGYTVSLNDEVTAHALQAGSLLANTVYYYNVTICDYYGNCNTTGPYTFLSPLATVCVNETGVCWTTIQLAIDDAVADQTVVITDNRTYTGALTVTKSLMITSNGTSWPTIHNVDVKTFTSSGGTLSLRYLNLNHTYSSTISSFHTLDGGPFNVSDTTIRHYSKSTYDAIDLDGGGTSYFNRVNFTVPDAYYFINANGGNLVLNNTRMTGSATRAVMGSSSYWMVIENTYMDMGSNGEYYNTNFTNFTAIGELNILDNTKVHNSNVTGGYDVDGYDNIINNSWGGDSTEDVIKIQAGSNLTIIDSNISYYNNDAMQFISGASNRVNVTIINSNFTPNKLQFVTPDGLDRFNVTFINYLDVHVANSTSDPQESATVNFTDNQSAQVFSLSTAANGSITRQNITYATMNGTYTWNFTLHAISASKENYATNTTAINMSTTQSLNLTLYSPPIISSVSYVNNTNNSVNITWTTDDTSNSTVNYGLTTSLGTTESMNDAVTSHSIRVNELLSNTTYYYNVTSCNSEGCTTSGTYNFTSPPTTVCINETGACYTTVQAAINAASAGQTVVITDNATYSESLTVNKNLLITSNGTSWPTINSSGGTLITRTAGTLSLRYLNLNLSGAGNTLNGGGTNFTDVSVYHNSSTNEVVFHTNGGAPTYFDRVNMTVPAAPRVINQENSVIVVNNTRMTGNSGIAVYGLANARTIIENSYFDAGNGGEYYYTNFTNVTIEDGITIWNGINIHNSTIRGQVSSGGYDNVINKSHIISTGYALRLTGTRDNVTIIDSNVTFAGTGAVFVQWIDNTRANLTVINTNFTPQNVYFDVPLAYVIF